VFASESQPDDVEDDEMEMSELCQKCQITPKVDKDKWSESSGSFILQGGNFINTLTRKVRPFFTLLNVVFIDKK
jgi:hypothetical protein